MSVERLIFAAEVILGCRAVRSAVYLVEQWHAATLVHPIAIEIVSGRSSSSLRGILVEQWHGATLVYGDGDGDGDGDGQLTRVPLAASVAPASSGSTKYPYAHLTIPYGTDTSSSKATEQVSRLLRLSSLVHRPSSRRAGGDCSTGQIDGRMWGT